MNSELKRTALYDEHVRLGGKMVPFAGYALPVQYETGIIAEHMAVRGGCGLFDVSHMGEIFLSGPEALANLNRIVTNDCSGMAGGSCRYSPMCNEKGGIVDDLIIYKLKDTEYLLVVNASNTQKDFEFISGLVSGDCAAENRSEQYAQLALQGPKAEELLSRLCKGEDIPQEPYTFIEKALVGGVGALVSRTGYTGEDGFELYCDAGDALSLWKLILEAGRDLPVMPCGLGARDSLRLEAALPLYGQELSEEITPYEALLGMFVKPDKGDFSGRAALLDKKEPKRKRTGLKMTGRGIAREGALVYSEGREVGRVTSGSHSPYLKEAIALALIDVDKREPGTELSVDIRGRSVEAVTVKTPFYKR